MSRAANDRRPHRPRSLPNLTATILAAATLAACSGSSGADAAPGSTVQPELVLLEYGRLADVYGYEDASGGRIPVLYRRDVMIGSDVRDERGTGELLSDGEIHYDFFGNDPDTLQPRLLIPRPIASEEFTRLVEALDDDLRTITPMRYGDGGEYEPYSVVPRNAAIRLTFSAELGVDDGFFVQRADDGTVTGLRNTDAVQLLRIVADPTVPGAFVPLPTRVIANGRTLVLDPVLLGTEGVQYQTSNNPAGLPASSDQSNANIRIAVALDGPLALPSLRERRGGDIVGLGNSGRRAIVRDFRSGNDADTSADIARGFVRDELPLRLVGSLPMLLERVDDVDDATQQVTLYKNGLRHEIDRGDVLRFVADASGTVFARAEVVVDPEDDRGQPSIQHVRVRIRRVAGLEALDPSQLPGYPQNVGEREPWLVRNAPTVACLCEFTAGDEQGRDDPANFVTFSPDPIALEGVQPAANEFVSPYADAILRFTKPVDIDSVKWADTLFFGMRDLTSSASREQYLVETGMDPELFDEAKYRTPFLVASRVVDEDGSQTTLRLRANNGLFLDQRMRQAAAAGQPYRYFVHVVSDSPQGGVRDLAGNRLDLQGSTVERSSAAVVSFTLDTREVGNTPLFEDNLSVSIVRRFESPDEDERPSPFLPDEVRTPGTLATASSAAVDDLFGAFLYLDGRLRSRPTTRTRIVIDNFNQSPPIQQPQTGPVEPLAWCPQAVLRPGTQEFQVAASTTGSLSQGPVQNPINPAGCRLQTLWRELDANLSRDNPFDFNLDIAQMYWAPFTSEPVYFDEFDRTSLRLGHSEYRPTPCVGDFSSLPSLDESGLRGVFEANYLRNQVPEGSGAQDESRAPTADAYVDQRLVIRPGEVITAATGGNRYLPLPQFQEPYFVWRDESVVEQGGDSGAGSDQTTQPSFQVDRTYAPYVLSPFCMGQGNRQLDGANGLELVRTYWNDARNFRIDSPNAPDPFTGGLMGSIAMPLLADYRTYPDSSELPVGAPYLANGINGWQTSVTVQSDPRPRYRVFSGGRPAGAPQGLLTMGPGNVGWNTAVGGWAPVPNNPTAPWTITPAPAPGGPDIKGDNTLYWIMMEVLRRRTVVTSGFVDLNNPHRVPEGFADPRLGPFFLEGGNVVTPAGVLPTFDYSFDPPLARLPEGTEVQPQFRAAGAVDATPWYWQRWIQTQNALWPAPSAANPSLTAAQREALRPTATNFPLDPRKAGDAHIRKWDTRSVNGSGARNAWTYLYNYTVTGYVEEPEALMDPQYLAGFTGVDGPFAPSDVRYVNWRFLMRNNADASPPIDPSIETFALSYRFQPAR